MDININEVNEEREQESILSSDKIFFPLSLERKSVIENRFFTDDKIVKSIVWIVIIGLVTFLFKDIILLTKTTLIIWIVIILMSTYKVAKKILEVEKWKKIVKETLDAQQFDLTSIWNIYEVTNDGIIKYFDYNKAVVYKCFRGSIIGRYGNAYEEMHIRIMSELFRELWFRGFKVIYLYRLEELIKLDAFEYILKKLSECDNVNLKNLVTIHLQNLYKYTKQYGNVAVDYFIVFFNSARSVDIIDNIIRTYLTSLGAEEIERLSKDKILNLFADLLGIDYLDYNELVEKSIGAHKEKFTEINELTKKFILLGKYDKYGNEIIDIETDEIDDTIDNTISASDSKEIIYDSTKVSSKKEFFKKMFSGKDKEEKNINVEKRNEQDNEILIFDDIDSEDNINKETNGSIFDNVMDFKDTEDIIVIDDTSDTDEFIVIDTEDEVVTEGYKKSNDVIDKKLINENRTSYNKANASDEDDLIIIE